ncbi:MAG: DNA cytosine methyltransferase, partial [Huintestinicola sp.]
MRNKTSKAQLSLTEEIFVDNFAGGGGASTGIELAIGRPVTIAINHDPDAIAMHKANHPYTEHFQESVWDIDPKEVCRGRPVALAWFSPDCKHFSRAKGGKPVDKTIRGLAWVAVRWARYVHPRVIMLENVPEFQTWGPLGKDNKPIKSRSGETFRKFIRHLQREGYSVKWQELKACDYGAPTIRKRFFLVARCDGKPIVFPKPTHGEAKVLLPYRSAAECIDWSIPCKSIFGRKKPLADATLRRIARGIDKFTIKSANPYIIPVGYGERIGQQPRVNDINAPLSTIVSNCKQYVSSPHISKFYGGITGAAITEPMPTVTAIDHNGLVASQLIQYHSETAHSETRGQALNDPL